MREKLQNRRASQTFELAVDGLKYTCTASRFADGRIGEIFLNNHKSNSAADVNARDAAIVASLALQFGVPVDVIRHALTRNADGSGSGPLAAALDHIATWTT
jgi:ribonucleoside-diphosphate reductase alpha chain